MSPGSTPPPAPLPPLDVSHGVLAHFTTMGTSAPGTMRDAQPWDTAAGKHRGMLEVRATQGWAQFDNGWGAAPTWAHQI